MGKNVVLAGLLLTMGMLLVGCLPLSVVGTSTEEVMAARQSEEPVATEPVAVATEPKAVEPEEPTEVVEEQQTVYALGERGPAGGFVFYDKGSYADGWRYLELAPMETETTYMPWGPAGIEVGETSPAVGSGYENTKLIVSVLGETNHKTGAPYPAIICDRLVYNGYDDWFLPSLDELLLMQKNLIQTRQGDFTEDDSIKSYWSSTEQYTSGNGAFAWSMYGNNGSTSDASKDFPGNVARAARRF